MWLTELKKPFNPLLGETYELIKDDLKIICEQVSHHPPVTCYYVETDDFIWEGYFQVTINFSIKGV